LSVLLAPQRRLCGAKRGALLQTQPALVDLGL
jgi:hypothetical protein